MAAIHYRNTLLLVTRQYGRRRVAKTVAVTRLYQGETRLYCVKKRRTAGSFAAVVWH